VVFVDDWFGHHFLHGLRLHLEFVELGFSVDGEDSVLLGLVIQLQSSFEEDLGFGESVDLVLQRIFDETLAIYLNAFRLQHLHGHLAAHAQVQKVLQCTKLQQYIFNHCYVFYKFTVLITILIFYVRLFLFE